MDSVKVLMRNMDREHWIWKEDIHIFKFGVIENSVKDIKARLCTKCDGTRESTRKRNGFGVENIKKRKLKYIETTIMMMTGYFNSHLSQILIVPQMETNAALNIISLNYAFHFLLCYRYGSTYTIFEVRIEIVLKK